MKQNQKNKSPRPTPDPAQRMSPDTAPTQVIPVQKASAKRNPAHSSQNRPSPAKNKTPANPKAPAKEKAPAKGNAPAKENAPAPELTPEQIEQQRLRRERAKARAERRRKAARERFTGRFLLFLLIFAVMAGLFVAFFLLNLRSTDSEGITAYTYSIGDKRAYTLSYDEAVRNGHVYVNFSEVASLCNCAMVGSTSDLKFIVKGDEDETIRFLVGTRVVYINTVEERLSSESYFENGSLYVPLEFVTTYFKGLDFDISDDYHSMKIRRIVTNADDRGRVPKDEEPIYANISFLLATPSVLSPLNEEEAAVFADMPDMHFVANLTRYESYMNPGVTTEYLTIVDLSHMLGEKDIPSDLVSILNSRPNGAGQMLRLYAARSLEALFLEMDAEIGNSMPETSPETSETPETGEVKMPVTVSCGYRSYYYQQQLYKSSDTGAYEAPGTSEFQTGLLVEMHNLEGEATSAFAETEAFRWLKDNCWRFGYILRYPAEKYAATGKAFNPCLFRYVGRYHSMRMREMGLCYEEYCTLMGIH